MIIFVSVVPMIIRLKLFSSFLSMPLSVMQARLFFVNMRESLKMLVYFCSVCFFSFSNLRIAEMTESTDAFRS